jgi:hypothetical protein
MMYLSIHRELIIVGQQRSLPEAAKHHVLTATNANDGQVILSRFSLSV